MKKIFLVILAITICLTAFVGCAVQAPVASEEPTQSEAPATQTEQPTQTPEETPQATEDPTPKDISPTTGLKGNTTYKPVIVQIENEPPARPQAGLQVADIVYESLIEGIDTRFTCIFNDTYPEDVGPVRSSRYYHQWLQQEWDALYVHQGGPEDPNFKTTNIYGESGNHIKQRVNGVKGAPEELLYRRKNTGKALEHTAYANVKKIAETYKYEPTQRKPFKFYPLESYADAPEIAKIELSFWRKPGFVEYRYDKATDKLIRYMGGKEFIAEETGKPLEVQNLVVQFVSVSEAANEGGRKLINVFGEGPAEFIIHGKYLKGKWSRPEGTALTTFTLENGEEVTFAPGNTWIALQPNDKKVMTTLPDGKTIQQ